jgi:hypothetical protein
MIEKALQDEMADWTDSVENVEESATLKDANIVPFHVTCKVERTRS